MDGTCLNSRSKISDQTLHALKKAAEAGIKIVPVTGRCLSCLPYQMVQHKELYEYVITSNGAEAIQCADGTDIVQALIPQGTALEILRKCSKMSLGIAAHVNHEYLLKGRGMEVLGHLIYGQDANNVRRVKNMEEAIQTSFRDVEELQLFYYSEEAREKLARVISGYPEVDAAYTKSYVEIYSKKASKGRTLSMLAKYIGIRMEEIACIGNGENDLSMFEASGLRLAVGNAVFELKKEADHILPSNDNNGVAAGIWTYILSERGKGNGRAAN